MGSEGLSAGIAGCDIGLPDGAKAFSETQSYLSLRLARLSGGKAIESVNDPRNLRIVHFVEDGSREGAEVDCRTIAHQSPPPHEDPLSDEDGQDEPLSL